LKAKKIFLTIIIFATFIVTSCGTKSVNFNKFESTRWPYLEVKVNPEYKYLSHLQFKEKRLSVDKKRDLTIYSESFFFVPNGVIKGVLPKYVYIKFENLPESRFVSPYVSDSVAEERDVRKLGWYSFEFATSIVFPNPSIDMNLSLLMEEGYSMPACILKRVAARGVEDRKTMMLIVYGEDASLSGFECFMWKDKAKLSKEQIEYIKKFGIRAMSAFEVVGSD
jgi:hypothetical protein